MGLPWLKFEERLEERQCYFEHWVLAMDAAYLGYTLLTTDEARHLLVCLLSNVSKWLINRGTFLYCVEREFVVVK